MQLNQIHRRNHFTLLLIAILATQASSFVIPHSKFFACTSIQQRSSNLSSHLPIPELLLAVQDDNQSYNLLQTYADLLRLHPLPTKSVTAAILACLGDAIAQRRSSSETYDARRGIAFLLFGASYTGAFQHVWFNFLQGHIAEWGEILGIWGPQRVEIPVDLAIQADSDDAWWRYFDIVSQLENPPSPEALAAGKLVMNQLVVIPLEYMPLFFAFTGLISGLDVNQSVARARSLYFPILKRNYFFWFPVQFIQFLLIPIDFQIPYVSAASLVWTVILSSIGGGSAAPAAPSSIVAYETEEEFGEEIVTISQVDPGPANEITDDVLLQDVTNALIPDQLAETVAEVGEVASNDAAILTTGGLAAGLFASAADEALIGQAVAGLIGSETDVGVALVAAASASIGLLSSTIRSNSTSTQDDPMDNE
ncbi:hypothetical protein ACHAWO_003176 [Cyclotella atomus]|uniref:Uncharacterized protein n=1 Tax=Cyclotella atomus TaxID=382360 RepID=A0ABD3PXI6_9STRA